MQPVRIGLNASVVLLVLLLSVPLQLLLSHLSPGAVKTGERGEKGEVVTDARTEAVEQLVDSAESFFDSIHSTLMYYSTWNHVKELVLVPYRRTPRTNLKSTVFKSKAGTTTILISSMDDQKSRKKSTSSSSSSSSTKTSGTTSTGSRGTGKASKTSSPNSASSSSSSSQEAVLNSRFHKPNSEARNPASSHTKSAKIIKKIESVRTEEVSQAKEVEEYLMNEVYFTASKTPRKRRSSVAYSVGQIVQHKTAGYVGVIIGWDEVAKAPEKWITRYYSNRKGVELTTHYLILVDSKYSASGHPYHYVPEEDIELAVPNPLRCPEISEYFEGFNNRRHIPKPWLKNRYPKD